MPQSPSGVTSADKEESCTSTQTSQTEPVALLPSILVETSDSVPTLFAASQFASSQALASHTQTSEDILARSAKTLFEGLGSLATIMNSVHTELQQNFCVSRGDLSSNLEKAIRASAAAVDGLRGVVLDSTSPHVTAATQTDRGVQPRPEDSLSSLEVTKPVTAPVTGDREESVDDHVKATLAVCTTCYVSRSKPGT